MLACRLLLGEFPQEVGAVAISDTAELAAGVGPMEVIDLSPMSITATMLLDIIDGACLSNREDSHVG